MKLRRWFWIEAVLAVLSWLAFVFTLLSPDWIENVFGLDPDAHSGSAEWFIVVALLAATIAFGVLARSEWRRRSLRA